MSDFLTRLAERALGVATIVEPSLPAVFAEPRDIVDDGTFEVTASPSDVESAALVADAATRPTAEPASTKSTLPLIATPRRSADTPSMANTAAAREMRASRDDPARDTSATLPRSPARPLVESAPAFATEPTGSPRTTPLEDSAPAAAARLDHDVRSPALQPLVPTRQPSVSSERIEANSAPRRATPEPAPSVRITIGRVEVRAVTPQPPPERSRRRQEAETPRVSLSDYLKRGGPQARNTR